MAGCLVVQWLGEESKSVVKKRARKADDLLNDDPWQHLSDRFDILHSCTWSMRNAGLIHP